jgi:hypothetical protein
MGLTAEIEPVSAPRLPGDWIGGIHRAARGLEESLANPEHLRQLADELTQVAESTGASMVTGASPLGNQLAGLVAGQPGSGLTLWAQNGAHGTLLVIEGVLASGAQLARTATRARVAGADRVVGVAVVAEPRGLAACRHELGDDVRALREIDFLPETLRSF